MFQYVVFIYYTFVLFMNTFLLIYHSKSLIKSFGNPTEMKDDSTVVIIGELSANHIVKL